MYFNEKGNVNTINTIELALKKAREENIKNIVVASSSGSTAKLFENVKDVQVTCVTLAYGSGEPGKNAMPPEVREKLTNCGIKVLSGTHALSGAERAISKKFGGVNPVEIIAHSLRMFGQGTKVCVEICSMAMDAGLLPYGEKVIAIGGSSTGADTAVVMTPAYSSCMFDTKIHEIICKPL